MEYKRCKSCVMDTSDSQIRFDQNGICDHCKDFKENVLPNWFPNKKGEDILSKQILKIKENGKNNQFDSIIGLSGGLDSSYLLHTVVKKFNLRPLVFHVDGGWNTSLAVNNIEMLVEKLGLELYTEVINWEEMKDLQLAFFKSGVPHLDIPQDHAFIATLYHFANKYNIKYILNGSNFATECVRNPIEWLYYGTDMRQINDIYSRFSKNSLDSYPFSGILYHKFYLKYFKGINVIKPLNNIKYIKNEAIKTLQELYGWIPYPQKHFESRFTRFFEGYWLPTRFGFDTRLTQFSSLILSNQMKRSEAIEKLKISPYHDMDVEAEYEYVSNKLDISVKELKSFHEMPLKSYKDYKNSLWMFNLGAKVLKRMGLERSIKR